MTLLDVVIINLAYLHAENLEMDWMQSVCVQSSYSRLFQVVGSKSDNLNFNVILIFYLLKIN